ncbi:SPX domain-containing protein 1-like [Actinidia eriantha]|uniref:SPX domain-containing protein 1-like n=1 Tax=Actinidia eriantha TaxID=165200 RepID=UPI002587D024|nr:SPX domain-containing protein 1-like [Actinidia eriantha]
MKFSKNLSNLIEQTQPDWRDQFLSYKDLKKQLKLIYPKDGGPSTRGPVSPNKRPRLDGGDAASEEMEREEAVVTKEVIDFVRLLEDEIDKFNAFFVDKEEECIIRLKLLKDRVADVQDSNEELMTVGREIVDFHGEMVLLLNYSALNYTGLVKILKKYDKRSGALIRLPFIQKVLQQPFFTTDILNKLVKECETMLNRFFSMNWQLCTYQATEGKEERNTMTGTQNQGMFQNVPEELAEIKTIESMYMKHTLTALEVLNKIRSGSSTVSVFSLPSLQSSNSKPAWKKIPVIEQAAK